MPVWFNSRVFTPIRIMRFLFAINLDPFASFFFLLSYWKHRLYHLNLTTTGTGNLHRSFRWKNQSNPRTLHATQDHKIHINLRRVRVSCLFFLDYRKSWILKNTLEKVFCHRQKHHATWNWNKHCLFIGRELIGSNASMDSTVSSKLDTDRDIAKVESYVEGVNAVKASYNPKGDPNHPWVIWPKPDTMIDP